MERRDFVKAAAVGAVGIAAVQNSPSIAEAAAGAGSKPAKPIELHISLEPQAGKEKELETLYRNHYVPGIKVQKGFRQTTMLRKRDALREYQIDIAFDSEDLRVQWVASTEHTSVWPKFMALCQRISWVGFDTV